MNDCELKAIEARAAAATPGPWVIDGYDAGQNRHKLLMNCVDQTADNWQWVAWLGLGTPQNAEFIAAARTDVPALCAALREARDENAVAKMCAETIAKTVGVEPDRFTPQEVSRIAAVMLEDAKKDILALRAELMDAKQDIASYEGLMSEWRKSIELWAMEHGVEPPK